MIKHFVQTFELYLKSLFGNQTTMNFVNKQTGNDQEQI